MASVTTPALSQYGALTLACSGTTTEWPANNPQPISMGLLLRTDGVLQGLTLPGALDVPLKITASNDTTFTFGGRSASIPSTEISITGSLDRITGDLSATEIFFNTNSQKIVTRDEYQLKCTPTQRLF